MILSTLGRLLGERYTAVVQNRRSFSSGSILVHVEGLQALADVLTKLNQGTEAVRERVSTEKISDLSQKVETNVVKLVREFTQYQRDLRTCASLQENSQALASKLSSRDSARARMCRELRNWLNSLFECVSGHQENKSDGGQVIKSILADADSRMQQLQVALDKARDCIIKYNVNQGDVSARMGADWKSSSSSHEGVSEALSLWESWKASMHYEQVAEATDACMQQSIAACAAGLGALLGVEHEARRQKTEKVQETLMAAGKAADSEAALHSSNPLLLVPATPLTRAAEHLLQTMKAQVASLQHASIVYDDVLRLHNAESQCLDLHGEKYTLKQNVVNAVLEASKVHTQARTRLRKAETLKHLCEEDPSLLDEEGKSLEEMHASILEKRRALKDAANVLHTALMSLLEVQDYFPEVYMHIKSGLPHELLSVWRPDLAMDMFEEREILQSGSNHTVYKAKLDGKMYALKEFKMTSDDGLKALLKEAAMLRKMRHPTIVEIVSVFEDNIKRRMLLQMPFFEHGTLDVWITSEAPEWRAVRTVLLDIATALEYLHSSSVVHCDVKPANILIAANCRGRLADFDISVDYATRTSTRFATIRVAYTAGFDAPELSR